MSFGSSLLCETKLSDEQWRSQDIAVAHSRAQHGNTTFLLTSALSAEAYRGSGGILSPKI